MTVVKQALVVTAVLALASPAWASHTLPNLSGKYTFTKSTVCWSGTQGSAPAFYQEVGMQTFSPETGIGVVSSGMNELVATVPVYFQKYRGLKVPYKVLGSHEMNLGGSDAYVQFGAVKDGIAKSAYLLYKNPDGSCTIQTSFAAVSP